MIIRSITLNNYRLYEGANTITFNTNDDKNIFLISGENGFGKTTFLHSLIWCLYGKLMIEVEAEVRKDIANNGYNAFLKGNLNNKAITSQLSPRYILEYLCSFDLTVRTAFSFWTNWTNRPFSKGEN